MEEFLASRKAIQADKVACLENLKTSLGHPTMSTELHALHETSKKTTKRMLALIDETSEKTLSHLENIANDFLGRVLFLSTFIGDISANWDFQTSKNINIAKISLLTNISLCYY